MATAASAGLREQGDGAADALPLQALPFLHRDPFDRMLISQSLARGIT